MFDWAIAILLALGVGMAGFTIIRVILARRERARQLAATVQLYLHPAERPAPPGLQRPEPPLDALAQQGAAPDLETRLLRAGLYGAGAARKFRLFRALGTLGAAALTGLAVVVSRQGQPELVMISAGMAGALAYLAGGMVIDRLGRRNETRFRKMFPDLLDLLIVCVDAGLGIEAAVDRVAIEFARDRTLFGQYVRLMALELRAGRAIDEALRGFARRTGVVQAAELAVLFRQSQELGTSIIDALRAFSHQMRQMRMIRAEETANQLPVRMLLPMAGFLFPVNLIIVLVPVMIRIFSTFVDMTPG